MYQHVFHDSVESKVNIFDDMNALYEQGVTLADQELVPDHKAWISKVNLAMRKHICTLKIQNIALEINNISSINHPLHRYHYQNLFDIDDHEVEGQVFRVMLKGPLDPTDELVGLFFTVDNDEIKDVRISNYVVYDPHRFIPPIPWEYPEHLSSWLYKVAKMYYDLYLGNYQRVRIDGDYVYPRPEAQIERCLLKHLVDVTLSGNIEKIIKFKTVLQKASVLLQHFVNNAKNYRAEHRYNADIGRWQFSITNDNDDQCYISYHHWYNDKDKEETVSFDICLRDEYIIYTTKHEKPYLEYYDNGVYTATTDDVWVVGRAIVKTLEEQVLWYISSGIR